MRPSLAFDAVAAGSQFRDTIAIRTRAPAAALLRAARDVTLSDMKLAWLLGEIRYLPSRLFGRQRAYPRNEPFLSRLMRDGTLILSETPREIIFGSAGRLHQIAGQTPITFANREEFDAFDDGEYEKLFMSLRVEPADASDDRWLVLEHATKALSPGAGRKFSWYHHPALPEFRRS